jgi:single-strand DNA-binding protein
MSYSVCQVIIVGFVGKDPTIKTFEDGTKYGLFSVATSESWADKKTGEKKERTFWHRVVVKNMNLVKIVESSVVKGSRLHLQGKLEYRKDSKDPNKEIAEIVIPKFGGELIVFNNKPVKEVNNTNDSTKTQNKYDYSYNDLDDEVPF